MPSPCHRRDPCRRRGPAAAPTLPPSRPCRRRAVRRCERLDAVFEQNITLLPRALRDNATLLIAPTSLLGGTPEEEKKQPSGEATTRTTGRRAAQVQAPSTLQLIELRKSREAAAADLERARASREKRERTIAEAEEWAARHVDAGAIESLRRSYDGLSLLHFLESFAAPLGVHPFSGVEIELGLVAFPTISALLRELLDVLLRHSQVAAMCMCTCACPCT